MIPYSPKHFNLNYTETNCYPVFLHLQLANPFSQPHLLSFKIQLRVTHATRIPKVPFDIRVPTTSRKDLRNRPRGRHGMSNTRKTTSISISTSFIKAVTITEPEDDDGSGGMGKKKRMLRRWLKTNNLYILIESITLTL